MKILFLSALESEAREFKKHYHFHRIDQQKKQCLYDFQQKRGQASNEYFWGITGVGPKSCRRFIKFISQQKLEFDVVILTGYCGALKQISQAGQVLASNKLYLWGSQQALALDFPLNLNIEVTESCTLKILADEALKLKILQVHSKAGFVDMESFYLAEFFQQQTSRLWLVRAVTDGPGFRFPDYAFIQDSWTILRKKGLLPRLLARPSQWRPTLALLGNIKKAGKGLFHFFAPLIQKGFKGYL